MATEKSVDLAGVTKKDRSNADRYAVRAKADDPAARRVSAAKVVSIGCGLLGSTVTYADGMTVRYRRGWTTVTSGDGDSVTYLRTNRRHS